MRLWAKTPDNTQPPAGGDQASGGAVKAASAGRALLAVAGGRKKKAPAGKVDAASLDEPEKQQEEEQVSVSSLLFDEPELQAGLATALEAELAAQRASKKVGALVCKKIQQGAEAACSLGVLCGQVSRLSLAACSRPAFMSFPSTACCANPRQVTAQSLDSANATDANPLDMPATLLLAGRYAANALLAELAAAEAPADAAPGTLDDYLFGSSALAAPGVSVSFSVGFSGVLRVCRECAVGFAALVHCVRRAAEAGGALQASCAGQLQLPCSAA